MAALYSAELARIAASRPALRGSLVEMLKVLTAMGNGTLSNHAFCFHVHKVDLENVEDRRFMFGDAYVELVKDMAVEKLVDLAGRMQIEEQETMIQMEVLNKLRNSKVKPLSAWTYLCSLKGLLNKSGFDAFDKEFRHILEEDGIRLSSDMIAELCKYTRIREHFELVFALANEPVEIPIPVVGVERLLENVAKINCLDTTWRIVSYAESRSMKFENEQIRSIQTSLQNSALDPSVDQELAKNLLKTLENLSWD